MKVVAKVNLTFKKWLKMKEQVARAITNKTRQTWQWSIRLSPAAVVVNSGSTMAQAAAVWAELLSSTESEAMSRWGSNPMVVVSVMDLTVATATRLKKTLLMTLTMMITTQSQNVSEL